MYKRQATCRSVPTPTGKNHRRSRWTVERRGLFSLSETGACCPRLSGGWSASNASPEGPVFKKLNCQGKTSRRLSSPRPTTFRCSSASRPGIGPYSSDIKVLSNVLQKASVCPFLSLEVKKGQLRALVDSGSARSIISSRAVSYTHLDVYKRQGP